MRTPFITILLLVLIMGVIGCTKEPDSDKEEALYPTSSQQIEIIYLGHPPVKKVVDEVTEIVRKHGIEPKLYDFSSSEGERFAKKKGITEHVPIVIYINGKDEFKINGRQITFYSFPSDMGNDFPVESGSWTYKDLDTVLQEVKT